ncbi:MAG: O-antigen ligase family protein [Chitinophagaceae bacterium]
MSAFIDFKNKISQGILSFLGTTFLEKKLNNWFGYIFLGIISAGFGYLIARHFELGLGLFGAILGLLVVVVCISSAQTGLYIIVAFAFFASFMANFSSYFLKTELPIGLAFDVLVFATFLGLVIKRSDFGQNFNEFTKSLLVIFIFFTLIFSALQFVNPNSQSIDTNILALRKFTGYVFVMFIAYTVLDSYEKVMKFFRVLFIISVICALYGCKQKMLGFFSYELEVLMRDPIGWGLVFNWGDVRISSTMSDPAAFGVVTAVCAVIFLILGIGEKKTGKKVNIFIGCIILITGMGYSGTRTAYAVFIAGLAFFVLLNFEKKSTRIFAIIGAALLLFILYAPIYGNSTIQRFRTTFNGSEDQSFKVRNESRAFIQPYIRSHPIGGGLGTTGFEGARKHPGHPLAMFQTDGGYVRRAAETGWTGLLEICILYFIALYTGIRGYFRAKDDKIKLLYAACVSCLFAFYIAEFAQSALGQITDSVVYYPILGLILRLKTLDSTYSSEKKTEETEALSESRQNNYS